MLPNKETHLPPLHMINGVNLLQQIYTHMLPLTTSDGHANDVTMQCVLLYTHYIPRPLLYACVYMYLYDVRQSVWHVHVWTVSQAPLLCQP